MPLHRFSEGELRQTLERAQQIADQGQSDQPSSEALVASAPHSAPCSHGAFRHDSLATMFGQIKADGKEDLTALKRNQII